MRCGTQRIADATPTQYADTAILPDRVRADQRRSGGCGYASSLTSGQ